MDEAWVAYLCMVLLVLVLILMKQKPDDEVKREKDTGSSSASASAPTTYYSGSSGRHHECSEEEIAASMERLSGVLFSADVRKRESHHEHRGSSSGKEGRTSTSHPGSHENLVDEIEQAVQEAADTDVYVRRRQPQVAPRSRHEGQWTEMK